MATVWEQIGATGVMIRTVNANDLDAIYRLHMDAFDEDERESVAQMAVDLLRDESNKALNAFVAVEEGHVVGCVIFSCVKVHGSVPVNASILAPLVVSKEHQRAGIGSDLVKHGLAVLKSQGVGLVFVYGDPNYYSRFGFAASHQVAAPYPLKYPEAWMACELSEGMIDSVTGEAMCASALSRPEYW